MGSKPTRVAEPLPGREFPGRYAGQRIDEWLLQKRRVDQSKWQMTCSDRMLWCIHGKFYDLSPFVDKHPGGREWLLITQGTECTGAFETHHLDIEKANKWLAPYYVKDSPALGTARSEFDWSPMVDGRPNFYVTLRAKVLHYLKSTYGEKGWKNPHGRMHVLSAIALSLFMAAFVHLLMRPSYMSAILAGLALHPLIGVGHNFFHQSDNSQGSLWKYVFNLTCFSFHEWRISHVFSHHLYINLLCDVEATAVEHFVAFLTCVPTNSVLVFVYWHVFNLILPIYSYTRHWWLLLTGVASFRWDEMVPLAQLLAIYLLACGAGGSAAMLEALSLFALMHGVAAYVLLLVSTPVHRGEECWSEGNAGATYDFGLHTVMSTRDYHVKCSLPVSLFAFEMFNDHVMHHLFCQIDISYIAELRPIFEEHLAKYGLSKHGRSRTFWGLFRGVVKNWWRVKKGAGYWDDKMVG